MRTLFICGSVPYPLHGGGTIRVYHLLKALAEVSDVTLVCPTPGGLATAETEKLRPLCRRISPFPVESFAWHQEASLSRPLHWMKSALRSLHPTKPVLLQATKSVQGRDLIQKLAERDFDLVWLERVHSLNLLPPSVRARVIVDLHDLAHRTLGGQLRRGGIRRAFPLDCLEFFKLWSLERRLTKQQREFIVCSELDKKILGGGARVWVVPNGVEVPAVAPASSNGLEKEAPEPLFVFVGSMDYPPNVDAVLWFARRVFPLICQRVPAAKLTIVGKDPDPAARRLHDGKSIVVTGTVSDVTAYLARAAVAVAPIRFGGGTRLKILEAMAHSKPVVATTLAAEGLGMESGKHLLLADSPENFAQACLRLLKEESLRQRLVREGLELICRQYQWNTVEHQVQEIVTGPKPEYERDRLSLRAGI